MSRSVCVIFPGMCGLGSAGLATYLCWFMCERLNEDRMRIVWLDDAGICIVLLNDCGIRSAHYRHLSINIARLIASQKSRNSHFSCSDSRSCREL